MASTCAECVYYKVLDDDPTRGLCRFAPPVVFFDPHGLADRMYQSVWPTVEGTDWCGDFEPPPSSP